MVEGAVFDSCIVGDYGECDGKLLSETEHKARAERQCCECHRDIAKGEKYWLAKGVWSNGEGWWSESTCSTCKLVRDSVMRGSWLYGELWSSVSEAFCHNDEDREAMLPESYLHGEK